MWRSREPSAALRVSPDVRACVTGDSGILMHVRHDRIYSLDRIGTEIWRLFAAGQTPDAIALSISRAHGAPLSLVRGDVLRFVDRLEHKGLVVRADPDAHQPSTEVPDGPTSATRHLPTPSGAALIARSVWQLLRVDLTLRLRGFRHVYRSVAHHRTRPVKCQEGIVAAVCRAVDRACTIYPRQALCLQRSAAAACLLRDHGVPARLVVGTRKHPFRAHAWVEVEGVVVNDKRGMKEYYAELDRL
jgi:Transglutaminase-like superfamily/Coenzyme PQQ synthesis protein D (PqqD)